MPLPKELYTVPNVISLCRALAGPVVMALIIHRSPAALLIAFILMILAEFSDVLDGMIARKFHQESDLGAYVDPVCDSIYHLSVFLAFLAVGWMPIALFFLIYTLDLVVPYLKTFAHQSGHSLDVRWSGKVKTVVQGASQIGVMAHALGLFPLPDIYGVTPSILLLGLATIITLLSLADYAMATYRAVNKPAGSP